MRQPAVSSAGAAEARRHYTRRPDIPTKCRQPAGVMSNQPGTSPSLPAPILSPELTVAQSCPRAAITAGWIRDETTHVREMLALAALPEA